MAVVQHIGCKLPLNIQEEEVGEEPQLLLELDRDLPLQPGNSNAKKENYVCVHFNLTM